MNHTLLTGNHIGKKYKQKIVLQNLSININRGDIYGLIGKNGCGKTTLFRILTGLIPNYDGEVQIQDVNGHQCKIAAVINSPAVYLNMTAIENLYEQAILLGIQDKNEIAEVLSLLELDRCAQKPVSNFSLGMLQRLKMGMALLEKPDLLFLDEPVNGLDPDGIAELRELLIKLNKKNNMTIVISSHILSELENTATCFGILNGGRIVKEFSNESLKRNGNKLEDIYMQYTKGGILS